MGDKTAVIYARVSSTGERQSTERQVKDLSDYALYRQMDVRKVFEEHISGAKKNEERPVLCKAIAYCKGHAKHITPFVGKQLDIAKAFGFNIPEGCDAKYKSRKSREKKVGRPSKAPALHAPNGRTASPRLRQTGFRLFPNGHE